MITKTLDLAGSELVFETGKLAKQADGAVMIRSGDTVVLATATAKKEEEADRGFFPMSVEYREKFYASGKIPGGFFKREARPSDLEVIAARLTYRPIRPLFPKGFKSEVQIIINTLSYDKENEADILGTIAASTALSISDIPWDGPIATVRIGKIDGKYSVNPQNSMMENSEMELIVSGTEDSIVMVEGEADFVSEDNILSAIQYAHEAIKDIINVQKELVAECGKPKREVIEPEPNTELDEKIEKLISGRIEPLNEPKQKHERYSDIDAFIKEIQTTLEEEYPDDAGYIKNYIDEQITADLRKRTLAGTRADGRDPLKVRDIDIDVDILPRTHGSAVFTRGETQALVVTTLGGKKDEQMLDNLEGVTYKRFMLHYNFPPYSVGEVRMMRSTSRREVGHGNLAERALKRVLPAHEDFPYTLRIVSDILESNGSSSMATVCGGTMSLMDAGVPIKTPIAGVAMGLVMESENEYQILTDILGTEDHLGDMDFKVAGSAEGVTAIQMDLKIDGLPVELMRKALEQARDARLHILEKMTAVMDKPRTEISKHAPKIAQCNIPVDMISILIGPGGKNIRALTAKYDCEISVEDDGSVVIFGNDNELLREAKDEIDSYGLVPEVGRTYKGVVDRITDFGCFVNISPTVSGLVHISELRWERVNRVEDVVKNGEIVLVKLLNIDDMGRYNFSMKALLPKPENFREQQRERGENRNSGGFNRNRNKRNPRR